MSLAKQNPTYERVNVDTGSLPYEVDRGNAHRGLVCDAAGTVTMQNENREDAAVVVPVQAGINPHIFNRITAVSGPSTVVAYW